MKRTIRSVGVGAGRLAVAACFAGLATWLFGAAAGLAAAVAIGVWMGCTGG